MRCITPPKYYQSTSVPFAGDTELESLAFRFIDLIAQLVGAAHISNRWRRKRRKVNSLHRRGIDNDTNPFSPIELKAWNLTLESWIPDPAEKTSIRRPEIQTRPAREASQLDRDPGHKEHVQCRNLHKQLHLPKDFFADTHRTAVLRCTLARSSTLSA